MSKIIYAIFFINFLFSVNSNLLFDYSHEEGSQINIQVGSLSSDNYIIPYSYKRLEICDAGKLKRVEDNLGEILSGEDLFISRYNAEMNKNKY